MIRVVLAVGALAAGGLVWTDAVAAAAKDINATIDPAKCDKTWGPPCFTPANGTVTQISVGDTVTWHATDGTHTVTPVDASAFAGSGDLAGPDGVFSVTFDKPGTFSFYCKHHGSVEDGGKIHHGMWGKIEVKGDDTTTSSTAPPAGPPPSDPPPPDPGPPPSTGPAHPPSPPTSGSPPPPAASNGSTGSNGSGGNGQTAAGSGRPWVGPPMATAPPPAPPPTRAAASGPAAAEGPAKSKEKKDGGNNEAASSPEATAPPPDEAVLPPSPAFPTPTTAPLAAPTEVPHGDTVAVLKNEPGGRRRKLVMFGTMFGVGAFAAGVGGWKYAHRASKYWPA